jgi:hypothetical protein
LRGLKRISRIEKRRITRIKTNYTDWGGFNRSSRGEIFFEHQSYFSQDSKSPFPKVPLSIFNNKPQTLFFCLVSLFLVLVSFFDRSFLPTFHAKGAKKKKRKGRRGVLIFYP